MEPWKPGASIDRIVEATEINYIGYLRDMASLEEVKWTETPEITWFTSAGADSWLNRILRFEGSGDDIRSAVDAALDIFQSKNLSFQWFFGPPAHRIGLNEFLEARGGRDMGEDLGMAVDLSSVVDPPRPAGLDIRRVDDLASATDWRDVLSDAFGFTAATGDMFRAVELNAMRPGSNRLTHVAYFNNQPVSIGTLYLDGGVAGILTIATISEARKQGFGSALTAHLLQQARPLGYHVGVLMASPMGAGVYRSLGFRKTCNFYRYEFTGSESER